MEVSNDQRIKHLCEQGDHREAFSLLLKTHQQPLYFQVRRFTTFHEDADDILQEVLIKAWKHLPGFRWESKPSTWLYRIAVNECLNFVEKQKRRPIATSEASAFQEQLHADPYFNGDELQRKLQTAIATLPEKQRLVFNLKYFDALKYEEIAGLLGGTTGSLKASYHHAVKKIERFFEED